MSACHSVMMTGMCLLRPFFFMLPISVSRMMLLFSRSALSYLLDRSYRPRRCHTDGILPREVKILQ